MLNQDEIVVAGLPLSFPKPTGNQLPTLAEWNQRYIEYVLAFTKGKKTAAARILGINRRTLYRRKKGKDGMDEPQDEMQHDQLMDGSDSMTDAMPPRDNDLHRMPVNHQVQ